MLELLKTPILHRRGRPTGRREAVTLNDDALALHDFAFLRAVTEGIDPGRASGLYLLEGSSDSRMARSLAGRLLACAVRQLDGLAEVAMAKQARAALCDGDGACTELPGEVSGGAGAFIGRLPTLDEFALHCDPDMYSERELIELFESKYGALHRGEQRRKAKIQALNWLATKVARVPTVADSTTLWLSASLCASFRGVGVLTLGDCVTFVNMQGRLWHAGFERLGRVRAKRLIQWLVAHEVQLGVRVSVRVQGEPDCGSPLAASGYAGGDAVMAAFVDAGAVLSIGSFRRDGVNTLGASNDLDAIKTWLDTLATKSAHTVVAYRREVERLLLWAVRERSKGLSSLDVRDAVAWLEFLANPPAHWICQFRAARSDADWRPLRQSLSPRSAARALAAVNSLFGFLVAANYLVANPFASLQAKGDGKPRMDVNRSFTNRDLQSIWDTVAALDDDPRKRRLVAVLHMLLGTGLRRDELVNLRWDQVKPLRIDGDESEHFGVTVMGKGMRERLVPLRPQVLAALRAHLVDREALVATTVVCAVEAGRAPLIGVLKATHWHRGAPSTGALCSSGLADLLKQFFDLVATRHAGTSGMSDFAKVSAHWMRHTFAHHALSASKNDLPTVQQLLGHASLATTGVYVKADMHQRLSAVLGMSALVGPVDVGTTSVATSVP